MSPRRRHLTQGELIEGEVTVLSSPAPKARKFGMYLMK